MAWMVGMEWSVPIQALTSTCTAVFAAASLRMIQRHTRVAQATCQRTLRAYEEGARPVLVLVKVVDQGEQRVAIFRNTGAGVAINITQTNIYTTYPDDNVLAPNQQTSLPIPMHPEQKVIEVRYESLTGRRMCTVSAFDKGRSIFNEYIPDAKEVGEAGIAHARGACLSMAMAATHRRQGPTPIYRKDGTGV